LGQVRKLRSQVKDRRDRVKDGALADALADLDKKAAALAGTERGRGERFADGPREPSLARLAEEMQRLLDVLQRADAAPTTQAVAACEETQKSLRGLLARWGEITGQELKALNERLRQADLPPLTP
jgi:hypothetical protein